MNHQTDCCGSVSECEQIERLIKSLLINSNIDQNNKDTLNKFITIVKVGKTQLILDQHIESHQQQLSQWVNNMDQFS